MTGLDSYDYIVVGAGISGLAFVDSLLSHSDARIALVDRRPHPGGHWNDAYSFIRLHLPSHMYGVNSRCFTGENTLGTGANRISSIWRAGPRCSPIARTCWLAFSRCRAA